MMFKKYAIIFLMAIAYGILLGHSIIPHHHHDNSREIAEHHQTNHGDGVSDISHLFSHFIHYGDGFISTTTNITSDQFFKISYSIIALPPDLFSMEDCSIPAFIFYPPPDVVYIFRYSFPAGLRAPPAFV